MPQNNDDDWTPEGPYRLKSGQHAGQTLEQILLYNINDFLKMRWALEKNAANPLHLNDYHRHLQWLIASFDRLAAAAICNKCGRPATVLPMRGNYHEGYSFIAYPLCADCKNQGGWSYLTTMKLSLWSLDSFKTKVDKKHAWKAVKSALGIPSRINDRQFFKLLVNINNQRPA